MFVISYIVLRLEEIYSFWSCLNVLVKRIVVVFKDLRVFLLELNFFLLIFFFNIIKNIIWEGYNLLF